MMAKCAAPYTFEQIEQITQGVGVFRVTLHNTQSRSMMASVRVHVERAPVMIHDIVNYALVRPEQTIELLLKRPYLSQSDVCDYLNAAKPELNAQANVTVTVNLGSIYKVYNTAAQYYNNTPFLYIQNIYLTNK